MSQISLYVDDPTMDALRVRAERENTSLSKYVGALIKKDVRSGWPDGFWDLYGALKDDTFIAPDELDFSQDSPRLSW